MHSDISPSSCAPGMDVDGAGSSNGSLVLRMGEERDRDVIYRMRHDVFAAELGQHATNPAGRLSDALDAYNHYIVVTTGDRMLGFVSITPPDAPSYSIDKYFRRAELPFPVDDGLYEIRLLTVPPSRRSSFLASALMYAAYRWIEARGGTHVVAIGRREIRSIHLRVGLTPTGQDIQSGAVTYGLLHGTLSEIRAALPGVRSILDRVQSQLSWQIGLTFESPAACYHGGRFFEAVGDDFHSLDRLDSIINADVLDAWFPPAPGAVAAVREYLPQILRTSPPTGCEGLIRSIARARGVRPECVLPGGGSSDLIFLAFRHWLTPDSRVLLLDPCYGEYAHLVERVIGCRAERLVLSRSERYRLVPGRLAKSLERGYDLVVLVNPNNPTGQHVSRCELEPVLRKAPLRTRVWVDEAYADFVGPGESLEAFAARSENVVVCKSMSKAWALSGARVAYLCGGPHQLESLRPLNPPWAVSLPAQVAAVKALEDPGYYAARYGETIELRRQLVEALEPLHWEILPGVANYILCHLPADGPDADTVIGRCRERGLYLRNVATMGTRLGDRALRIAVKDAATNRRMVKIIFEAAGARHQGPG